MLDAVRIYLRVMGLVVLMGATAGLVCASTAENIPGHFGRQALVGAMTGAQEELKIVAYNLNNVQIPGQKQLVTLFEGEYGDINDPEAGILPNVKVKFDLSKGPIVYTGVPTDFALNGEKCVFQVLSETGEKVYTFNGRFHFSPQGELLTAEGLKVTDTGGTPIAQPVNVVLAVRRDGTILHNGQEAGKMGVFKISDDRKLKKVVGGFAELVVSPAQAEECEVLQGSLEQSNISSVQETVRMMELSNLNAIRTALMKTNNDMGDSYVQYAHTL